MHDLLVLINDKLGVLDCFKTCKIGLEATMNGKDYPFCRIEPVRALNNGGLSDRKYQVDIYVGVDLKNYVDTITIISALDTLEKKVTDTLSPVIENYVVKWITSELGEDLSKVFKVYKISFEMREL